MNSAALSITTEQDMELTQPEQGTFSLDDPEYLGYRKFKDKILYEQLLHEICLSFNQKDVLPIK